MKLYIALIILLSLSHYAVADTTLEFKNLLNDNKQSSILYQIKQKLINLTETPPPWGNMFAKCQQAFIYFEPHTQNSD